LSLTVGFLGAAAILGLGYITPLRRG